jgi:membrane protease YdiL (CAAX protease family)
MAPDGRLRALWRFVAAVAIVFLANYIAALAGSWAGRGRRFELVYRPLTMLLLIAGFSALLKFLDRVPEHPLPAMGLRLRNWRRDALIGMALGAGMVTAVVVCIGIFGDLEFRIQLSSHLLAIAIAELFILAAAAMAEELMFRGYPFQRLVEAAGPWAATLVLSGLFGAVHLQNPNASIWGFLNTVLVGVLLSVAYLRTRSLWLPWGLHFAWNAMLGFVFGLPVSGIKEFAVLVKGTATGPLWLTGGSYGIEASALGAVAIIVGLLLVLRFVPRDQPPATVLQFAPQTPPLYEGHRDESSSPS